MLYFFGGDINDPEYIEYLVKKSYCLFNALFDYELVYPSDRYDPLLNPMKKTDEKFHINILNNIDYYTINFTQVNKYYFENAAEVKKTYNPVFKELKKYVEQKKSKVDITEFFESFAHTSHLENVFSKTPFSVVNGVIHFLYDDTPRKFIHICEFYIGVFRFNCSGSYMFLENMLTQEQYMYYAD